MLCRVHTQLCRANLTSIFSIAGDETRQIVLSEEPYQGLQSGDIVYFLSDRNDPYTVKSIQSDPSERGSLHAFAPCEDASVDASHHSCYLEIVREGKWIGFHSMYAQSKFLQARRKGTNKLCFFNSNFGTWEQFELFPRDTDVTVSWSRLQLTFQSRRLPQFRIKVTVCRVGHFSGSKSFYDPKMMSLAGSKEDQRVVLSRVSDVMVKEWVKFVEKEIKEREATAEKIELMRKDTKILHKWTTNRLVELKDRAREDIGILQEALDKTNAYLKFKKDQLKALEEELRAHCLVILDGVTKRRDLKCKLSSFLAWQKYTAQSAMEHYAESQMSRMRSKILLNFIFGHWRRHTIETEKHKRSVASFQKKQEERRAKTVLREWIKVKHLHDEQERRVAQGAKHIQMVRLNALMCAWLGLVAFRKKIEAGQRVHSGLTSLHNKLILQSSYSQWRQVTAQKSFHNHILGAFTAKSERNRLKTSFKRLRSYVHRQRTLEHTMACFSSKCRKRTQFKIFQAWALVADISSEIENQKVDYFVVKSWLYKPFAHWRQAIRVNKQNERMGENLKRRHQLHLMRRVLLSWESYAKRSLDHKFKCDVIASKSALATIRKAFGFWQAFCDNAKWYSRCIELVLTKHERALLRRTFVVWMRHGREIRANVLSLSQNVLRSELRAHFAHWKLLPHLNREKAMRKSLHNRVLTQVNKQRLRKVLEVWAHLCSARKDLDRHFQVLRSHSERRVLWKHYSQWQRACQERAHFHASSLSRFSLRRLWHYFRGWRDEVSYQNQRRTTLWRCQRKLNRMRLARCFSGWKSIYELSLAQASAALQVRIKVDTSLKRVAFHGWVDTVFEQRQYEELVEKLVRRFSHNLLSRLFTEWRAGIKLLVHYRKTLDRCANRSRFRMTAAVLSEWTGVVRRKRVIRRSQSLVQRRMRRTRMFNVFVQWYARARRRIREEAKVGVLRSKLDAGLKREAFNCLQEHAWNRRTKQIKVERFGAYLAQKTIRETFGSWRDQMVHGRRLHVVCNRLLMRQAFIAKSRAFDQWVTRIHRKNESLSNIRRCVKRKQVSLNFFLSWYWAALDDDVQFTLTKILHNAAPGSAEAFAGRDYKPLFNSSESPVLPKTKRRDVSVNPLASKNLLPRLELESIRLGSETPSPPRQERRREVARQEEEVFRLDMEEVIGGKNESATGEEQSSPSLDLGAALDAGAGVGGTIGSAGEVTMDTPPGLESIGVPRGLEETDRELRAPPSPALSVGLAELLCDEDEEFLRDFSPVTSLVNTPSGSRLNSPLASPFRGRNRAQRIENFVEERLFDWEGRGDER